MGDSLTYGMSPNRLEKQIDNPWFNQVVNHFSALGRNYGINGSTVCNFSDTTNPMIERIQDMEPPATVVLFMGGVNDFKQGVLLGRPDSAAPSYSVELRESLRRLKLKYPQAVIFLMTSLNHTRIHPHGENFQDWVMMQKHIAKLERIKIIDLNQEFEIDISSAEDIRTFIPDGLHLSQKGANIVANIVINRIESVIEKK